jgi:hypothetical protein
MKGDFPMNLKRLSRLTVLAGPALVLGLRTAGGQQTPPTENKGMKAPLVASLDLGQEIDDMQGRQLRMRVITLEPGGVIAVHPHKDRPSVVYLLQGNMDGASRGWLPEGIPRG